MPTNYQRGRAREYRLKHDLEAMGYLVMRASGSHSPFDLMAIHPEYKEIRLLQVKPKRFGKTPTERLEQRFAWVNDTYKVIFGVASTWKQYLKSQNEPDETR